MHEMSTRPVNLRFPIDLYNALQDYAKANRRTVSDVIFSACEQYLTDSTPGLCPSCHTQNPPDAHYCLKCGEPITSAEVQTLQNRITELEETLDARVKTLVKEVIEGADWIDQNMPLIKKKMEEHP